VLQASLREGIAGPGAAGRVRRQVHVSPGTGYRSADGAAIEVRFELQCVAYCCGEWRDREFSAGRRARLKGYRPWEKVELASAVGNTAVEAVWLWKVTSHAQHLLCRLHSLVLPRYAQGSTSWYCDSESEPGWKAYLIVNEFAGLGPIS
jgi:hypothetical protein